MADMQGQVALVTGGVRGIGLAICERLAARGVTVAAGYSRDKETAQRFLDTYGDRGASVHQGNIGSNEDCERVIHEVLERHGHLDILVNNAGIIRRADAVDFTESDWDAVVDTNLKSVFFLCQAAGKHMIAKGHGKIVNIASMLSFQGGVRVPSYTASKSGVAGLTKLLANEWAAKGVNVNAIAPGYIATNNTAALQADEARNKAIMDRIPAGRWGSPDDMGGAAVFLASSASDYVNGHILAVDGGWLAR
jgi:2-dehydro-3-deoxy-D-gluconate 5-dehydrogenase